MNISPGTRLGPYQISEPLGAGGMGEVYRARDTRLDRSVAIKVLPAHLSGRADLRERFEREARTVSSLNHPNICTLYDIGAQDGVDFLVMEFLEGETLADRLGRSKDRPLPLDEALGIAIQMADALATAHRAGVVHRDLKPGNIVLTKSGAKLLDFGLAKQSQPAATMAVSGMTAMPTVAAADQPLTAEGTILGTLQYMAPEQLEGREADGRTDIFAFGALLYEMVTGRRAFQGKSHVSLIAAIIDHDPPPISSVQPVSPPLLDHLVKSCLTKNPDKRWQNMGDVLMQLKLIADSGGELGSPAAASRVRRRLRVAWVSAAALAAFLVTAVAVAAILLISGDAAVPSAITFEIPTPAYSSNNQIAISRAGTHIAAQVSEDGGMLWVRSLERLKGQTLAGTQGGQWPFWSPDGRFVAFFAGGKLKKVDLQGAPPQVLADAANGAGGSWNGDGTIVFAATVSGPLFRVSAAGGAATALTELDTSRQELGHRHPYFLPDDRHFLYVAVSSKPENSGIFVSSLGSTDRTFLVSSEVRAAFAPPNHLLFMRESTLMAQTFDPKRLELSGEPFPIAEDVGINLPNSAAGFSVSAAGTLAYRTGASSTNTYLTWFDRNGKDSPAVESPSAYQNPVLSPDLQHIAVARLDGTARDIWILDLVRGTSTRFTVDPADDSVPIWSPDGSRIVFRSNRGGAYDLYEKSSSGVVQEEILLKSDHGKGPEDWSADGRFVLYRDTDPKTGNDLWVLPMTGEKKPEPVVRSQFNEIQGRFSPDGRWIAYASNESGRLEVYVQGFPRAASRTQISTGGGAEPHWRGDGKELFFSGLTTTDIMAVDMGVSGNGGLLPGIPRKLFAVVNSFGSWGVTPNGQRFLMNTAGKQTLNVLTPITVFVNWLQKPRG